MPDKLSGIEISDLSISGEGVGRDPSGRVIFVPFTVPGDQVSVHVTQAKKSHCFAQIESIEKPSTERIEAVCPHFGICGGCDWQHLAPDRQAHWKARILYQTLRRIGRIELDELPKIQTMSRAYATRSRLRLHVNTRGELGFFRRKSNEIAAIKECPVAMTSLAAVIPKLQCWLKQWPWSVTEIRLLASPAHQIAISLHLSTNSQSPNKVISDQLATWWQKIHTEHPAVCGLELWHSHQLLAIAGDSAIEAGNPSVIYRPSNFAQASWEGNQLLVEQILRIVTNTKAQSIIELYAGCGNFSLPIAATGSRILALDIDRRALQDAQTAAQRQQIDAQYFRAVFDDQEHTLRDICHQHDFPNTLLLLDPPRRGLSSKILNELIAWKPTHLLYISCDPATCARDLRTLIAANYELRHLSGVDLIPQTAHVEIVALLSLPNA
jgi:23S rRNA (uracil1939-C5)-methyltransferase